MRSQARKVLILAAIVLCLGLTIKYLKQYIFLSFKLLSLKFFWIILIVLIVLTMLRKKKDR